MTLLRSTAAMSRMDSSEVPLVMIMPGGITRPPILVGVCSGVLGSFETGVRVGRPIFMPGIWPLWEGRAGAFAAPAFSQAEKTRLPASANRVKAETEG